MRGRTSSSGGSGGSEDHDEDEAGGREGSDNSRRAKSPRPSGQGTTRPMKVTAPPPPPRRASRRRKSCSDVTRSEVRTSIKTAHGPPPPPPPRRRVSPNENRPIKGNVASMTRTSASETDAMESLILQRERSSFASQPQQPAAFESSADSDDNKLDMEERINARYREFLRNQYCQGDDDNESIQRQDQPSSQYQMHMKRLFVGGCVVNDLPPPARRRGSMQHHRLVRTSNRRASTKTSSPHRRRSSSSPKKSSHRNPQDSNNLYSRKGKTDGVSDDNDSDNDTVMSGDRSKASGSMNSTANGMQCCSNLII